MVSNQINNFSHSYQYLEWFHLIIIFSNTPHKATLMDKLSILHLSTCTRPLYKVIKLAPSLIVSLYCHSPQALTLPCPSSTSVASCHLRPQGTEIIGKKLNFPSLPIQIPNS